MKHVVQMTDLRKSFVCITSNTKQKLKNVKKASKMQQESVSGKLREVSEAISIMRYMWLSDY